MAGGRKVKPENARRWQGPWERLPPEEIVRRQAKFPNAKLCGFENIVERNRAFRQMYRQGLTAKAIATHYGVSVAVVQKARRITLPRGRFESPQKQLRKPKVFDPEHAIAILKANPSITSYDALARRMGLFKGTSLVRRLAKHSVARRRMDYLLRFHRLYQEDNRKACGEFFGELCRVQGRVLTSRDLQDLPLSHPLKWHKVRTLFNGHRVMARLCIRAGIDPKETRRQFWKKYLSPEARRKA